MEITQLRVGVLGVGLIGRLHARVYRELSNAELVGVADQAADTCRRVAEELGTTAYGSLRDMLESASLDAVSICVPDSFHVDPAVAAAEAGVNLLVEKPLARTVTDANRIVAACRSGGVRLMVAHLLQFDPRYAVLRDRIRSGELGEVLHMYAKRHNPNGIAERLKSRTSMLFYVGIHDIEMVNCYAGSLPVEVFAQKVEKKNATFGTQDFIVLSVRYRSGAIANFNFSWALPTTFPGGIFSQTEVVGTDGAGYVSVLDQGTTVVTDKSGVEYPDTLHWPEVNGRIGGDLRDEIQHFVTATLERTDYVVSTESAIDAIRVIEAAFRSIASGVPERLEDR